MAGIPFGFPFSCCQPFGYGSSPSAFGFPCSSSRKTEYKGLALLVFLLLEQGKPKAAAKQQENGIQRVLCNIKEY
jgi:hypothetical protein